MTLTCERTITYLLVEDNDEHANIVEKCLPHNHQSTKVCRVKTGADCLAYLAGDEPFANRSQYPYPDVVLLDIRMPGIVDGLQTLKAIRADSRHSSLSVMMLTTSDRDQDVSLAYKLGANGYIVKSDDTGEMIEKLLQLHRSFETWSLLPKHKQENESDAQEQMGQAALPPLDAESFLHCSQDAALDMLVATYQRDREEALEMLKTIEQINITRFAGLLRRFCTEKRHLFASNDQVDWVFLREIVMERLPKYVSVKTMAGLVTSITATLESNRAARRDNTSWQLWQGFCCAYFNQDLDEPLEPVTEPREALPWNTRQWKYLAIAAIIVLFALLTGVLVRNLW